jgi:hypothetical protein
MRVWIPIAAAKHEDLEKRTTFPLKYPVFIQLHAMSLVA